MGVHALSPAPVGAPRARRCPSLGSRGWSPVYLQRPATAAAAPLVDPHCRGTPSLVGRGLTTSIEQQGKATPHRIAGRPAGAAAGGTSAPAPMTREQEATEFERLCDMFGVERQCLLGTGQYGRGLLLKNEVMRDRLVLVPLEHTLCISDEGGGEHAAAVQDKWQEIHGALPPALVAFIRSKASWDTRLAAWLLWAARSQDPLWKFYSQLIPTYEEQSGLLMYTAEEAEAFQSDSVAAEASRQRASALAIHTSVFAAGGELGEVGLVRGPEDTLWALGAVRSRTFSEKLRGDDVSIVAPFCDMVNHSFEPMGSFGVDKQQRGFEIRSNRRGAEGSESTICYGHERKNDDLIRDYGFIMEGNPNDRLPMQEMEEAGMLVHRALLFATLGVDPAVSEDWRVRVGTSKREGAREGEGEGGGPDVAMRRLRACIDSFPCSNADGGRQPSGVDSMRLELELAEPGILREQRDVADRVREHLEGLLERYPTSAEEDEALLLSSELSPRELAAVMHRLEAKKLIEAGVEALEAYWDELEL